MTFTELSSSLSSRWKVRDDAVTADAREGVLRQRRRLLELEYSVSGLFVVVLVVVVAAVNEAERVTNAVSFLVGCTTSSSSSGSVLSSSLLSTVHRRRLDVDGA